MLTPHDIALLQQGQHPDPFAVLGMHQAGDGLWVHAFFPGVLSVELLRADAPAGAAPVGVLQRQGASDAFRRGALRRPGKLIPRPVD